MAKFDLIAFDAQYFLRRNFEALKARTAFPKADKLPDDDLMYLINTYEFDEHDLVKVFFWSIAKIVREIFPCRKILLLWDIPPYHKLTWVKDFKGTRAHHCQETLDEWDIENDPQGYLQEKENIRIERIQNKARWWIIDNLGHVGMPSIWSKGYEADDLAVCINNLHLEGVNGICSIDSDWMYWINEDSYWLRPPASSSQSPTMYSYQDALDDCEGLIEEFGISVFEMKKYMDSTFLSHNDLPKCSTLSWGTHGDDFRQLYNEIKNGDYTHITDVEVLNNNLKSFEIDNYPGYDDVLKQIKQTLDEYHIDENYFDILYSKGFKVSKSYFNNKFLWYLTHETDDAEWDTNIKLDVPTRL